MAQFKRNYPKSIELRHFSKNFGQLKCRDNFTYLTNRANSFTCGKFFHSNLVALILCRRFGRRRNQDG